VEIAIRQERMMESLPKKIGVVGMKGRDVFGGISGTYIVVAT